MKLCFVLGFLAKDFKYERSITISCLILLFIFELKRVNNFHENLCSYYRLSSFAMCYHFIFHRHKVLDVFASENLDNLKFVNYNTDADGQRGLSVIILERTNVNY